MRYDTDHKRATRQRIVKAAGRRFKQDGIDGAGLATVMSDAGLTNGAFYGHFTSKEDLVANVLIDQLRTQREGFQAQPPGRAGLEAIIRAYLSPSTAISARTAAHPPRCSTRSGDARMQRGRLSLTRCSASRTTWRRGWTQLEPTRRELKRS